MLASDLAALFERDLTRLVQELRAFPDTPSLWATLPGIANAAGTLALHLEGNLREFIGRQLGGVSYARDRAAEFSVRGVPQAEVVARLKAVHALIPGVVSALPHDVLDANYPEPMFGGPITTRQFVVHLNGHLNYHLGQIDYLRRAVTGAGALDLAPLGRSDGAR
jgi:hypothetical protein